MRRTLRLKRLTDSRSEIQRGTGEGIDQGTQNHLSLMMSITTDAPSLRSRTSVVRQVDEEMGHTSGLKICHSGHGVRLELVEVTFERSYEHLRVRLSIVFIP